MADYIVLFSGLGVFLIGSTVSIALCCLGKMCYKKIKKYCCPENSVHDINCNSNSNDNGYYSSNEYNNILIPTSYGATYIQQPDKIYSLGIYKKGYLGYTDANHLV